jgi:glyoxylase-like metal-dependent hydrolase (beta-lactamase superfamily II)
METVKRYRLGEFEIIHFQSGRFCLDGGTMFGIVPKVLWSKKIPPDDKNRIPMATNPIIVKVKNKTVLVDPGIGDYWDSKMKEIYKIESLDWWDEVGIGPDEIDYVIVTHLHFDHTGGSTVRKGDEFFPAFPKARYIVQHAEWYDALNPNERTRASYIRERFVPFKELVELVNGNLEILPGVRVINTGGHTRGHQVVLFESLGKRAVYLGDLIPMVYHLPLPYIMAYDNFPLETLEKKKEIYREALRDNWLLLFEHDPEPKAGYIKFDGNNPPILIPE